LFFDWLQLHYPLRANHVIALLRQCRGGADNDSRFGYRMSGTGTFANLLTQRFQLSCKRLGMNKRAPVAARTDLFIPPEYITRAGVAAQDTPQIDLFG
jgi:DNA repair photolyase